MAYWYAGKAIHTRILRKQEGLQSSYGEKIVYALGRQLQAQHGKSFSRTNVYNCIRSYHTFPEEQTVHTLSGQLYWSHFRLLIYLENKLHQVIEKVCILLGAGSNSNIVKNLTQWKALCLKSHYQEIASVYTNRK